MKKHLPIRLSILILPFFLTFILVSAAFAQAPTVSSFAPLSGVVGAPVTITGTGFNTTPGNNVVFFGATKAAVTVASATSLTVNVPAGATHAPITVLNTGTGLAAYSRQYFVPVFTPTKGDITSADLGPVSTFATGASPQWLAVGDFNGDGKPDVASTSNGANTVSILTNTSTAGNPAFAAKVDYPSGAQNNAIVAGDLDGDGWLDLAVTLTGSNSVGVLLNTASSGTPGFAPRVDFAVGGNPYALAIGDLDGDGRADLAASNALSNTISILRNTGSIGNASFAPKVDFAAGNNPFAIAVSDLDGDGKAEVAVTNLLSDNVSVYLNTGSPGNIGLAAKLDFATGTDPQYLAISDLDGDGKLDLAVANTTANSVSVIRNTSTLGNLSFAAKADFTTGATPVSLTIGDIDGDAKPDLLTNNLSAQTISVLRNIGTLNTPAFATKVDLAMPFSYSSAIIDMDSDGMPEITAADYGNNRISVWKNSPVFPPVITSFTPLSAVVGTPVTIAGTGFNSSTANNIVFFGATRANITAASATSLTVNVPAGATHEAITVLNTGTGLAAYSPKFFLPVFTPVKAGITAADFEPKVDFSAGLGVTSVAMGDLDGDGKPDLAIVNSFSNTVSVRLNTGSVGSASFAAKVDFATDPVPGFITIGDIDRDGKPDLALTHGNANTVSVLRNTGSIGAVAFAPNGTFVTGDRPNSVAIGDIDHDGRPDLVTSNGVASNVSVLRNTGSQGTIAFDAKSDFAISSGPRSVAIGDIDGDGKVDLVTANTNQTATLLRSTGGPGTVAFAAGINFTAGGAPATVAIGDLDGDGKPDLAIANASSNDVSVLRNTGTPGSPGFASKVDFPAGVLPSSMHIGDFDGNGKPDLAIANSLAATLSVLRNTGSSGNPVFAAKVDFTIGPNPQSLAVGDVDGDGRPDLVTANSSSANVSVLLNTRPSTTLTIVRSGGAAASTNAASVSFTVTFANAVTGLTTGNFSLTTTGAITGAGISGISGSGTTYTLTVNTGNGDGTIRLNLASNTGLSYKVDNLPFTSGQQYIIDRTLPNTAISGSPPALSNSASAAFTFASTESGTFQASLDGAAFTTSLNPVTYTSLAQGAHTLAVRAVDDAGNIDTSPATYSWTIDLTAPPQPVVITPGNNSLTTSSTPVISGTAEPNTTITVVIDGGVAGTASADGSGNWSFTPPALAEGSHTARATATDAAGNVSPASGTISFIIDALAGDASLTNLTVASTSGNVPLSPAFTAGTSAYTASVANAITAVTLTPTAANSNTTITVNGSMVVSGSASANIPLAVGVNTITTMITSRNGSTTRTYTVNLTRQKADQTITFASLPAAVYGGSTIALAGTASSGLTVTYVSSNTSVATISGSTVTIAGAGTTTFTASQSGNATYNAAPDVPQTLTVNPAPLIITAENKNKTAGAPNPALTLSYNGFVNGEGNNALNTPPSVSTTATIASAPGNYPITASGAASANYSISYVNGALTVTSPAPADITLTQETLFENQAAGVLAGTLSSTSGDPAATYSYSLVAGTGSEDNASFSISGNEVRTVQAFNFEAKSSYSIRVRGTNAYSQSFEKSFMVSISDINEAPALSAIANQSACNSPALQTLQLTGISPGPEASQLVTLSVNSTNSSLFGQLSVTSGGTLSYQLKDNATGTAVITVTVKDNGGTANGGSDTFSRSFTLSIVASPQLAIASGTASISKGASLQLTASGAVNYTWANASGILSGQNSATLTVRPSQTTTYTVTGNTASGCSSSQSVTITVIEDYNLVANNVLTPNGDGRNDVLAVSNIDMYPDNEMKIFDRAGRVLYAKKSYNNDWDGTLNGSPLQEDTYYYILNFPAGKTVKKGYISVIRKQ